MCIEKLADVFKEVKDVDDSHTGSAPSFKIASAWLAECQENHNHCKKAQSANTPLPSRVISVGPADESAEPYLLETHGKTTGRYVALSHCWGSSSGYVKTTLQNVDSHKSKIKLDLLPQTFKDAIKVVRKLGIQYLWIDSLCIIQDDVKDWEKEAALMGWYYKNSLITISAAHGKNSDAGLFKDRDSLSTRPCEFTIHATGQVGGSGQQTYAYAREMSFQISKSSLSSAYGPLPLHTRAWILQEQLLSLRTLTYSNSGISWRCQMMRFDERAPLAMSIEDFINDQPRGLGTRRGDPRQVESMTAKLQQNWVYPKLMNSPERENQGEREVFHGRYCCGHEEDHFIKDWAHVVQDYTSRGMTRQSDKLVAIRGIADVFASLRSVKYTAGIFNSSVDSFVQGLLWSSFRPGNRLLNVAPSWSWASVQCEVRWLALYCANFQRSVQILDIKNSETVAQCKGEITLRTKVRLGIVGKDGKIRIAKWPEVVSDKDVTDDGKTSLAIGLTPHQKDVVIGMDEIVQANSMIYFVELATGRTSTNRDDWKVHALALVTDDLKNGQGHFRRVGFSTWDQGFWREPLTALLTEGEKGHIDLELRTMEIIVT
jgi:hypothetical protein